MEFSEKIQQDVNEFLKVFIEVVVNITGEESFGEQYTTVMESTIKCMMCEHLSTKTQLYTFLPLYIEMSHQNKVISSLEGKYELGRKTLLVNSILFASCRIPEPFHPFRAYRRLVQMRTMQYFGPMHAPNFVQEAAQQTHLPAEPFRL